MMVGLRWGVLAALLVVCGGATTKRGEVQELSSADLLNPVLMLEQPEASAAAVAEEQRQEVESVNKAKQEQEVKLCHMATEKALNQIALGNVLAIDPEEVLARAAAKVAKEQDSRTMTAAEKVEAAEAAEQEAREKEADKAEKEAAKVTNEIEASMQTSEKVSEKKASARTGKKAEVKAEVAEAKVEAKIKKLEKQGERVPAELGEGMSVAVLGEETVAECHAAAIEAIKKAMGAKQKGDSKETPAQRAIRAVEQAAKAKQAGSSSKEAALVAAAKKAEAVAKAKSPMAKTVAEAEQAKADRKAAKAMAEGQKKDADAQAAQAAVAIAKAKTPASKRKAEVEQITAELKAEKVSLDAKQSKAENVLVKTARGVENSKGTLAKAKEAQKLVTAAKSVEKLADKGVAEKAAEQAGALRLAKKAASQSSPSGARVVAEDTEKELKKVEHGTPQSEVVAAVRAEEAAKKLRSKVLNSEPVAKAEAEAISAAKAVGKVDSSPAAAVAAVKAVDAAKVVENNPTVKTEKKLVSATANLQGAVVELEGECKKMCKTNQKAWEKKCNWAKCKGCSECQQDAQSTGTPSEPPTKAPSEPPTGTPTTKSASQTVEDIMAEMRAMDARSKALSRCTDIGGNLTCDKVPWGADGDEPQGSKNQRGDKYSDCSDSLNKGMYWYAYDRHMACQKFDSNIALSPTVIVTESAVHLKAMGLKEGYKVLSRALVWKVRMAEPDVGAYGFKRVVCEPKSSGDAGRCHVYKIGHCIRCPNFQFLHSQHKTPTRWTEWVSRDGEGGLKEFATKCLNPKNVYDRDNKKWHTFGAPFKLSQSGEVELKAEYACTDEENSRFKSELMML